MPMGQAPRKRRSQRIQTQRAAATSPKAAQAAKKDGRKALKPKATSLKKRSKKAAGPSRGFHHLDAIRTPERRPSPPPTDDSCAGHACAFRALFGADAILCFYSFAAVPSLERCSPAPNTATNTTASIAHCFALYNVAAAGASSALSLPYSPPRTGIAIARHMACIARDMRTNGPGFGHRRGHVDRRHVLVFVARVRARAGAGGGFECVG